MVFSAYRSKDFSDIKMEDISTRSNCLDCPIKQEPPEECLTNLTYVTHGIKQESPEECLANVTDTTREIKQEPPEEGLANMTDITCEIKQEPLDVVEKDINNHRQILVDIGLGRKKVFIVHNGSSLSEQFHCYIYSDPAFSELLGHSFPVLQEFSAKFDSWVDMDTEENLKDGGMVKAVFFPRKVETDETKPGAIKRKRDDSDSDGAPRNKLQCIRPEYEEQFSVSFMSSLLNETDSPKKMLPTRQPKVLCTEKNNTTTKETELKNCAIKRTPEKKNNFTVELTPFRHKRITLTPPPKNSPIKKSPQIAIAEPLKKMIHNVKNSLYSRSPYSIHHISSDDVNTSQPGCNQLYGVERTWNNISDEQLSSPISSADIQSTSKEPHSLKQIKWTSELWSKNMANQRLEWAKEMIHEYWPNTVFTDVLTFSLPRNEFKDRVKGEPSCVTFWICLTSVGPKVLVPIGPKFTSAVLLQLLKDVIISFLRKDKEIHGMISLHTRHMTQFETYLIKKFLKENNIYVRFWPSSARNISPTYHVQKLLREKLGIARCSSKKELISFVSQIWENDFDVKAMCKNYVSSLPKIINSIVEQQGKDPVTKICWG